MTGVVRNVMWSQLHTFTVPPANSSLAAVPPTLERASSTSVRMPAFARYAAATRPLWPAPMTMASWSVAASIGPSWSSQLVPSRVGHCDVTRP